MRRIRAPELTELGLGILSDLGVPEGDARIVMEELVETSLMGLDSHGIMRLAQYVRQIGEGSICPGVEARIVRETPSSVVVDGGRNFGMVTARFMCEEVATRARGNMMSAAVSRHTHHVGRLGSFVERLAREGFFAIAVANASKQGHYTTPWGGTKGRLGTNPLAYGCPRGEGKPPLVLDMSTSMIAEGSIRAARQRGEQVPPGCILDPEGVPTTDPEEFYRDGWGAILPFGGELGYKGFGLSLMVELLGASLAGEGLTPEGEADRYINGFFVLALDPEGFCGREDFVRQVEEVCAYMKSSPAVPGGQGVVLPGERDHGIRAERLAEGIPIPDSTWDELMAVSGRGG